MITDWLLMRRAAVELDAALRGLRVVDCGELDDGRTAIRCAGRGRAEPISLVVDAFASPPLVTLETAELALRTDPGWLRTVGTTLRAMRCTGVTARRGDRVIAVGFGSASRFGVEAQARLVLELVPRFGNVVLLRDRVVVAAAKQFSPADNEARAVQVGLPYESPPLPRTTLDEPAFLAAVAAAPDARARTRALGGLLPELPRLLAASVVAEIDARSFNSAAMMAAALATLAAQTLEAAEAAAPGTADIYVYTDAQGALLAAHVLPLAQFADVARTQTASLLDLFARQRADALREQLGGAANRRRTALGGRVARRLAALTGETARIDAQLADAAARDRLRESGDALFTHVNEISPGATLFVPPTNPELTIELDPDLDVTTNAQRYYTRYRKAANAVPHLEARRDELAARVSAFDDLAFEIERADAATLPELERDLDVLEGRKARPVSATQGRRRAPLRFDRPSGARIYVGRSPLENVEVTFKIARPDDLWFHARGIPGSHVVLQAPPGGVASDDDLDAAAHLAAAYSKARASDRVDVDFTERKHVRKQRDGGPGLVWYTHARTRVGRPDAVGEELQPTRAR